MEKIFNESSPLLVFEETKRYATLLQRSLVLNNNSANITVMQKIHRKDFSVIWLSKNAALDPQQIQAAYLINSEASSHLISNNNLQESSTLSF